jgi:hypothetical protein
VWRKFKRGGPNGVFDQDRGLRLIATLHDPAVIRKILAHLGIAPLRAERRPRPTGARRRRALIGSSRARWTPSCLRGEASSALIRPVHLPVDRRGVPA